jgi:hypothetical protein
VSDRSRYRKGQLHFCLQWGCIEHTSKVTDRIIDGREQGDTGDGDGRWAWTMAMDDGHGRWRWTMGMDDGDGRWATAMGECLRMLVQAYRGLAQQSGKGLLQELTGICNFLILVHVSISVWLHK